MKEQPLRLSSIPVAWRVCASQIRSKVERGMMHKKETKVGSAQPRRRVTTLYFWTWKGAAAGTSTTRKKYLRPRKVRTMYIHVDARLPHRLIFLDVTSVSPS